VVERMEIFVCGRLGEWCGMIAVVCPDRRLRRSSLYSTRIGPVIRLGLSCHAMSFLSLDVVPYCPNPSSFPLPLPVL
jgi:hypothetical protein